MSNVFDSAPIWDLIKERQATIRTAESISGVQAARRARVEVLGTLSVEERGAFLADEDRRSLEALAQKDPKERLWTLARRPRQWKVYLLSLPDEERGAATHERNRVVSARLKAMSEHDRATVCAAHPALGAIWRRHLEFQARKKPTPSGQKPGNAVAKGGAPSGSPAPAPGSKRKVLSRWELEAVFAKQDAKKPQPKTVSK